MSFLCNENIPILVRVRHLSFCFVDELGSITCGAVPMAIGVQADMATPALVNYGSEELKQQFLVPTIAGDFVACLGVSESGAGSDVASIRTTAVKKGGLFPSCFFAKLLIPKL